MFHFLLFLPSCDALFGMARLTLAQPMLSVLGRTERALFRLYAQERAPRDAMVGCTR
ncbi:hypothetical protein NSPZN2_30581 [Nitrospira defluvii]|uniref:Uncharacterized protein n=1 Tax=Nitrospira defluvii TaxID=330214 RepID=A0ABN7LMX7_9BACT|nr:hypothetical protein NSPZN2_30581 [Nitrospira defluvii]